MPSLEAHNNYIKSLNGNLTTTSLFGYCEGYFSGPDWLGMAHSRQEMVYGRVGSWSTGRNNVTSASSFYKSNAIHKIYV